MEAWSPQCPWPRWGIRPASSCLERSAWSPSPSPLVCLHGTPTRSTSGASRPARRIRRHEREAQPVTCSALACRESRGYAEWRMFAALWRLAWRPFLISVADGAGLLDDAQVASPEHTSDPAATRWTRSTIYLDMWVDPDDDPRETRVATVDERTHVARLLAPVPAHAGNEVRGPGRRTAGPPVSAAIHHVIARAHPAHG